MRVCAGIHREAVLCAAWDSLPGCHLDAEVYTDKYTAYQAEVYNKYHHNRGEVTQHLERFNNTLRQRIPRLTHKTLSFSESLQNHIGPSGFSSIITTNHYLFSTTKTAMSPS